MLHKGKALHDAQILPARDSGGGVTDLDTGRDRTQDHAVESHRSASHA